MFYTPKYNRDQINKIGNTIIYLCKEMPNLSKTKLLKLIYLIQESSIKAYGIPFFNLKFNVWKLGPVSTAIFAELSQEPFLLSSFIDLKQKNGGTFVVPKQDFCDDEFNDLELDLLSKIARSFKNLNANQLIEITHKKNGPWYITACEHGLIDAFDAGLANVSDVEIDMSKLLEGQPEKLSIFNGYQEFLENSQKLKNA